MIHEKSPYLLQHAYNPVDWFPWSDEAFEKAKSEDKPIFLSIGYSTCHWCHVMERESFEDEEVSDFLNKHFVAIKVDREERPDIDHIYMTVCQAITGHGGWPLSVFLTPDKKPFYAGTYFPKNDRMGMVGFITLLKRISDAWNKNHDTLLESSDQIINIVESQSDVFPGEVGMETLHAAFRDFEKDFDSIYGGFGSAPKFPTPHNLYFLLRYWYITKNESALKMVEKTLDSMHRGGIYDHIGFGFSRYSTDRKWLVPHFEKMLYDNALLAIAYVEAFQATKKSEYAEIANQIFAYVLRDMTSPEGAFYSAEDADSEGVEGKFYVWTPAEVNKVLGEEAGIKFCTLYDITERGNFEGKSIPNLLKSRLSPEDRQFAEECRQKLFEYREKRIHPHKDDKILTAWNGLMIAALSIGGRVLGNRDYIDAAAKAADFILQKMVREDGRLLARYRDGHAAYPAYLDDYSFLVWGLIELYQATYRTEYLRHALRLNDDMVRLFLDEKEGGLFIYGSDSEQLISRPKELYDGATPSGNSVSTMNFLKLARLAGRTDLEDLAQQQFYTFGGSLNAVPRAYAFMLSALGFALSGSTEVVLVEGPGMADAFATGDMANGVMTGKADTANKGYTAACRVKETSGRILGSYETDSLEEMTAVLGKDFHPFTVSVLVNHENSDLVALAPYTANYVAVDEKTTAYVCRNFSCMAPVTTPGKLAELLSEQVDVNAQL